MPCYRICKHTKDYNNMRALRKWWEDWDLRILILYILIAQLYLLFFGRNRRKKMSPLTMIVNVSLLYLFADLLATIALGKLSKIKVDDNDGMYALRVLWAPLILFYLGGPETVTVVRLEENQLWVKHLVGLLMQGLRTAYALLITWSGHVLSLLAVLMFIPGIIKYGERVWVVRSRSKDYRGLVHSSLPTIDQNSALGPNAKLVLLADSWLRTLMPHKPGYKCNASIVRIMVTSFRDSVRTGSVDAFKLIEIELGLMYDILFSKVGTIFTVRGSILRFLSFSFLVSVLVVYLKCEKPQGHLEVDHIITIILLAGAIFLEIAGIVVQLVSDWALVWACKNRATSVLFLHEFLISKSQSWFLTSHQKRSQRWSGVIGQFSFRVFCTKYKPTVCNNLMWRLFGRERMLNRFSSQESPVPHLKDLIIGQLLDKSENAAVAGTLQTSRERVADIDTSQTSTPEIANVDNLQTSTDQEIVEGYPVLQTENVDNLQTSIEEIVEGDIVLQTANENVANVDNLQTSTEEIVEGDTVLQTANENVANVDRLPTLGVRSGEWTLVRYNLVQQFKWTMEQEFGQSIVIWHVATEVCYELDHPKIGKDKEKLQAVKILSDYMMYLLVACPSRFPFCNEYDKIMKDYADMQELFDGGAFGSSRPEGVGNEGNTTNIRPLVNKARRLVLDMKGNPKRWDIMGSMWVEMLCYAAMKCPWNNHIQGLRNGGEFLTHVWLLLMHFGVTRKLVGSDSSLNTEEDGGIRNTRENIEEKDNDDGEKDTSNDLSCEGCFFWS
ncbi:uncharacterized protein LOC131334188 [Rhododendron vialii]|uniref:uncharacterized protein LOC131334188 n=1 Tax=Rhododendron vialii TaxID=182163 RepID=UPI00265F9CDE|nr:uncharacterized protein LOC131334188 [Rhododendron vialii]XP_058225082.1 uncharacterized protein LOC131334188 [Rhododendron vialii]